MARAVIFVGPSLPGSRPVSPGLAYAPPARRGELAAAAQSGVAVIGLVDGLFYQDLAVTPREVRDAAAAGARLFGAASMGALRACDCPDAMTGVGTVYQAFRDGSLTGEDEVAGTFAADSYATLAFPLVQVRRAVALARRRHHVPASAASGFLARVSGMSFEQRTLPVLVELAAELLAGADIASLLRDPEADVKAQDARALVARVTAALAALASG
ncbi:MAG TPA: TfuA-like protein [Kofleriaceae bacterium]|jgi:hypothetical protein